MNNPIWKTKNDIKIPSGFLEHRDNVAITRSINILKDEVKDEVAIFGKTMGPWTLAYHVFGVEPFLLKSIDDPEDTREILRKLMDITILFGQAQIDSGADVLVVPDHATGDLVSGKYYDEFLLHLHQELVEELKVLLFYIFAVELLTECHQLPKVVWLLFILIQKMLPKKLWML